MSAPSTAWTPTAANRESRELMAASHVKRETGAGRVRDISHQPNINTKLTERIIETRAGLLLIR
jgi:hypothetical protein